MKKKGRICSLIEFLTAIMLIVVIVAVFVLANTVETQGSDSDSQVGFAILLAIFLPISLIVYAPLGGINFVYSIIKGCTTLSLVNKESPQIAKKPILLVVFKALGMLGVITVGFLMCIVFSQISAPHTIILAVVCAIALTLLIVGMAMQIKLYKNLKITPQENTAE